MNLVLLIAINPKQRRIMVELCSHGGYRSNNNPRWEYRRIESITRGSGNMQFAQASSRGILVGTNAHYLEEMLEEYYKYSEFVEIKTLLIEPKTNLGSIYDELVGILGHEEYKFVIFPVSSCVLQNRPLKYFEIDNAYLAHNFLPLNETESFELMLMKALRITRGYICQELGDGSFCYTSEPLRQISLLTTPYFHSLDSMSESISICPISFSGIESTEAECIASVAGERIDHLALRQNDIGSSLIQAANFVSTLYQLHADVSTNKIERVIVEVVKQAENALIEEKYFNEYKAGQGFGIITERLIAVYLEKLTIRQTENTGKGRIFAFVIANVSNYQTLDIEELKPSEYSSFESHKIAVLLRNAKSDIYDGMVQKMKSNITSIELEMLCGYHIYLFDNDQQKIVPLGTIGDDNHVMFTSDINLNNLLPWKLELVISRQVFVRSNMSKLKSSELPLDIKSAIFFSGYHTNISITIINPESSHRVIYFTMRVENYADYLVYYQCEDGGSRIKVVKPDKINDLYRLVNLGYPGFCRIVVCDSRTEPSHIMYLNEVCGLSMKIKTKSKVLLLCWLFCFLTLLVPFTFTELAFLFEFRETYDKSSFKRKISSLYNEE